MEEFVKAEFVSLKKSADYTEKWVQDKIQSDPSILNLGDLEFKDSERPEPSGGRLDVLLFDPESKTRYEVEIQLGGTDESHIIRTIEYWDYERRHFPQYDHCAVIVAEDITSRFLNVIALLNGTIPIIAIQMKAVRINKAISLVFTTVLNESTNVGFEGDDQESSDRKFWEAKSSKESLAMADSILKMVNEKYPGYQLTYKKHYIGLSRNGLAQNFLSFIPRKASLILQVKHDQGVGMTVLVDDSDLEELTYDKYWKLYQFKLKKNDVEENGDTIRELIRKAYSYYNGLEDETNAI